MNKIILLCVFSLIFSSIEGERLKREDETVPAENEVEPSEQPAKDETITTTTAAPPPPPPETSDYNGPKKTVVTTPDEWIKTAVERHNYYRRMHGVPDLTLNQTLSEISQAYADHLAETDTFEHSKEAQKAELGENLYFSSSTIKVDPDAKKPVDDWYDEINNYDFKTGFAHNDKEILHFTQLVWKDTTQVGTAFAVTKTPNGKGMYTAYVVANYYPRGNWDDFLTNVLPKKKDADSSPGDDSNKPSDGKEGEKTDAESPKEGKSHSGKLYGFSALSTIILSTTILLFK